MSKFLFNKEINGWASWSRVFQSISDFEPLIEQILKKELLPFTVIEPLTPGTNAVFKIGNYVVKIFAPQESGFNSIKDYETELFSQRRAIVNGIPSPKVIANGIVDDRYSFRYLIMEFLQGFSFDDAVKSMTRNDKIALGYKLRVLTDKMNTPCEAFNNIDVIKDTNRSRLFDNYPESFRLERLAYLNSHNFGDKVFVHGDLCGDNILINENGGVSIIDFADACLAPLSYEQATVAVELFGLDEALLKGYFGEISDSKLVDICFDGLIIHDFGAEIIEYHIAKSDNLSGLSVLREKIHEKIICKKSE